MKFLLISIAIALAFIIGANKTFIKASKIRISAIIILSIAVLAINIIPEIHTDIRSATHLIQIGYTGEIPILLSNDSDIQQLRSNKTLSQQNLIFSLPQGTQYQNENLIIVRPQSKTTATIIEAKQSNITFAFPFIPGLEAHIRLFPFHVSSAWIALLGFLMSLYYSIQFLRKNDQHFDHKAFVAAKYGFISSIAATILGMIWAKHSWGSYWNWDPRELSIFILLSIYLAYFILRQSIANPRKKARFSAVYSIFAGASAPFFIFIIPRITSGLHPGSTDDPSSPIISQNQSILNTELFIVFCATLFVFTLIFLYFFHRESEKKSS